MKVIIVRENYNNLCVFNFGKRCYVVMKNNDKVLYFESVNGKYVMPITNFSLSENQGKSLTSVNHHFFMNQLINRINVSLKKGYFTNDKEIVDYLADIKSAVSYDMSLKSLFKGSLMGEINEENFERNKREILKYLDRFKFDTSVDYNNVSIFDGSLEKKENNDTDIEVFDLDSSSDSLATEPLTDDTNQVVTDVLDNSNSISLDGNFDFTDVDKFSDDDSNNLNYEIESIDVLDDNKSLNSSDNSFDNILSEISDSSLENQNSVSDLTQSGVQNNVSDLTQSVVQNNVSDLTQSGVQNNVSDLTQSVVQNNVSDLTQSVVQNNVDDLTQGVVQNSVSDLIQGVVQNNVSDLTQSVVQNNVSDLTQGVVQNSVSDLTQSVVQDNDISSTDSDEYNSILSSISGNALDNPIGSNVTPNDISGSNASFNVSYIDEVKNRIQNTGSGLGSMNNNKFQYNNEISSEAIEFEPNANVDLKENVIHDKNDLPELDSVSNQDISSDVSKGKKSGYLFFAIVLIMILVVITYFLYIYVF